MLEIGFGSGLNIPYYPAGLMRVRAVDPAAARRRLAAGRAAARAVPIEYMGSDAGALPVAGGSVDHVLSTWTLCTIPDAMRALAEVRRVLRPGGAFRFVEHGLAPDPSVARPQQLLTPWRAGVPRLLTSAQVGDHEHGAERHRGGRQDISAARLALADPSRTS